jgi:hypothetical protein
MTTSQPIPIPSSNSTFNVPAPVSDSDSLPARPEGVECPPSFLARPRNNSTIRLDVFHHPAELHTPDVESSDPLSNSFQELNITSPRNTIGSPMVGFESARSPVLAIHHSRVSDVGDDDFPRSISGLSLSTDEISPPHRNPSFSNDTTYVPMTPLPSNCILSFLDRPREMATLIAKNAELFRLIQHALSPD